MVAHRDAHMGELPHGNTLCRVGDRVLVREPPRVAQKVEQDLPYSHAIRGDAPEIRGTIDLHVIA
jgi:hypothetical protein